MNAGLFLLALRRTLPVGLLLVILGLFLAATLRDWESELVPVLPIVPPYSAFARQGTWILFSVFLLPLLLIRAAGTIPRWRAQDADWLAPRAAGRLTALASTFSGTWVGGAAALLVAAAAAEIAANSGLPGKRVERSLTHAALVMIGGRQRDEITFEDLSSADVPPGAYLLLRPTIGPGSGPAADVVIGLEGGAAEFDYRITDRSGLELLLPDDCTYPLTVYVERKEPGAAVIVPANSTQLLVPVRSERLATLGMLLRELSMLGAWIALGLGLGAWTSGSIAALLVLCLWFLPWFWNVASPWFPGGDLLRATTFLGEGFVPPPIPFTSWLGCVLALVLGLTLAARGLSDWRNPP